MKKKLLFALVSGVMVTVSVLLAGCASFDYTLQSYDMNILDLSNPPSIVSEEHEYLFDQHIIQGDHPYSYLGHPDNVLLDNGNILTAYPLGHGKGETLLSMSEDTGITWNFVPGTLPESFKKTEETPTLYKLNFVGDREGDQKLLLASGRPGWGENGEGFDVSISKSGTLGTDGQFHADGLVWEPHKNYFSEHAEEGFYAEDGKWEPIVAFASLTQLKDANGNLKNEWMAIFHDYGFNVLKTILTFDDNDQMIFTEPARVIDRKYRLKEKLLRFCEPETIRSPDGNELAMLFRTNAKKDNSYVIFSTDEGITWSAPKELSYELTGERHKAEYDPVTGKLVITHRAINWKLGQEHGKKTWYSRGWVTWVGDYSDLKEGLNGKGDYVIKMAYSYHPGQTEITEYAHADTGYAGITVDSSGLFVASSYGRFAPADNLVLKDKTYIVTKRFRLNDLNAHFGLAPFPVKG